MRGAAARARPRHVRRERSSFAETLEVRVLRPTLTKYEILTLRRFPPDSTVHPRGRARHPEHSTIPSHTESLTLRYRVPVHPHRKRRAQARRTSGHHAPISAHLTPSLAGTRSALCCVRVEVPCQRSLGSLQDGPTRTFAHPLPRFAIPSRLPPASSPQTLRRDATANDRPPIAYMTLRVRARHAHEIPLIEARAQPSHRCNLRRRFRPFQAVSGRSATTRRPSADCSLHRRGRGDAHHEALLPLLEGLP